MALRVRIEGGKSSLQYPHPRRSLPLPRSHTPRRPSLSPSLFRSPDQMIVNLRLPILCCESPPEIGGKTSILYDLRLGKGWSRVADASSPAASDLIVETWLYNHTASSLVFGASCQVGVWATDVRISFTPDPSSVTLLDPPQNLLFKAGEQIRRVRSKSGLRVVCFRGSRLLKP
ncbi:hypothetical protein H072_9893 [Dactylellina haptotyla CBS 200.50]|uniref:Uncharacterized protein n=1 Tax=Dactylellina haptotyla (strain CBS 200.50) TaxID=1284197 RepID=S8BMV0_DACHA|nr:hypothetical protein H072_9893 [Dactylellina haptotyla CBS 200.50]